MKHGWCAAVLLAEFWLMVLLAFLQHALPVTSSPAVPGDMARDESLRGMQAAPALARDVVINEVAWSGTAASSSDEWIELYNNTTHPITLTGWRLDASANGPDITLNGVIWPRGYFLLERTDDNTVADVSASQLYGNDGSTWALNDSGEVLTLTDTAGNVMDTANGSGGWPAGTGGAGTPPRATMERIDPLSADARANWVTHDGVIRSGHDAGGSPINGTPKKPNSARSANLGIVQSGPSSAQADRPIRYTLTFSNAGRLGVAQAIITDVIPPGVTFNCPASPYTCQTANQRLVWQVGALLTSSGNLSVTFVVTPEAGFTGWLTYTAIITSETPDYYPDNNMSTATTQVAPISADLSVCKSAPASVAAGNPITYAITISNVGELDAPGVLVTDTLPVSVSYLSQSSPYTFTRQGRSLVWEVGHVPPTGLPIHWTVTGAVDVNSSGVMTNTLEARTVADEPVLGNNSAAVPTLVVPPPVMLINGVLVDGYQLDDADEAIQIINVAHLPVNLENWRVTEGTANGVSFTRAYSLPAAQRLWLARNSAAFFTSFGFWPDFAVTGPATAPVSSLSGAWPSLANAGGEVQLKDSRGTVVDRLVYGAPAHDSDTWMGQPVQAYGVGGVTGQILARVPDERTGSPAPDTNTAADWIQYAGNSITGRRVLYPGWDMTLPEASRAGLFWPFTTTATAPATVTLGVAPDHADQVVRAAIRSARQSIEIESYELTNYGVITEVVQKARAGVSVTVLLEGGPVGGLSDQELWACREIEAAAPPRGQCWFMHTYHPTGYHIYDRYDLLHQKTIILDRQRLVISTQNLSDKGMPDDDKSDGTYGSRGYVLYVESPPLAARAGAIFERDLAPVDGDIARWSPGSPFGFGLPPGGYAPITASGGTTTAVLFPAPAVVTDATRFELFTAPEAALRQSDALLGLLARAGRGDAVDVEQMSEYPDWGDPVAAPNVRLQAMVDAARRGARVRLLLNSGSFDVYADIDKNITTTAQINALARQAGLDLEARLGNPTRFGIHSKLVLVRLATAGLAYSHVGSLNGSEASSKVNREMAVQVESHRLHAELSRAFEADWTLSAPVYLPGVMRNYTAPDHALVSEVLYDPAGNPDAGREWIELYNPLGVGVDLSGWSLGDAAGDGEYGAGRYVFPPNTSLPPGGVIVIAGQAADVAFRPDFEFLIDPNRNDPAVPDMQLPPGGAWAGFGLALGNAGDHVILRDAAGQTVDAVVWGDSSYPGLVPHPGVVAGDHSLERRPADQDTGDCAADFFDRIPPTPGAVPQ